MAFRSAKCKIREALEELHVDKRDHRGGQADQVDVALAQNSDQGVQCIRVRAFDLPTFPSDWISRSVPCHICGQRRAKRVAEAAIPVHVVHRRGKETDPRHLDYGCVGRATWISCSGSRLS